MPYKIGRLPYALLAALLVVLGACGDDEPTASEDPAAEGEATSSEESAFPVTIEHANGSTTVEERPERIVTLNVQWTDAVVAMGVTPLAYVLDQASGETEPYPWQRGRLEGAERIDTTGSVPYEKIAALRPDLILTTYLGMEPADFDKLRQIAPTIGMLGDLQVDPWEQQVEVVGQVLGEADRADDVVAGVHDEVGALAADLPGLEGKTYVAANYVAGDGIYVIADPEDGASRLFYALGMEIAPEVLALDPEAVGRVQISTEQVGVLDADFIGILTNGSDPAELPGWDRLRAVQSGAVVNFELADVVGLNTPTPLSVPHVIDLIRPALEAAAA